jgi:integrase
MRWSELELLSAETAVWRIPGSRTKNKQGHLVPLTEQVQEILAAQPKVGDLLFSTTGETPVSGFGRAKLRLDARANAMRLADALGVMTAWTLHDLRRTMVTLMNERLSVPPHIVEAVVNHMSGAAKAGVAGVYNRALYLEERRSALERWAAYLDKIQDAPREQRLS